MYSDLGETAKADYLLSTARSLCDGFLEGAYDAFWALDLLATLEKFARKDLTFANRSRVLAEIDRIAVIFNNNAGDAA